MSNGLSFVSSLPGSERTRKWREKIPSINLVSNIHKLYTEITRFYGLIRNAEVNNICLEVDLVRCANVGLHNIIIIMHYNVQCIILSHCTRSTSKQKISGWRNSAASVAHIKAHCHCICSLQHNSLKSFYKCPDKICK